MQNTTYYGLNKPDLNDFYNVEDFNENMDTIDTALFELQSAGVGDEVIEEIKALIGAAGDTGGSTSAGSVMGKLNTLINTNGIKTVMIGLLSSTSSTESSAYINNISLPYVNPDKCALFLTIGSNLSYPDYFQTIPTPSITKTNLKFTRTYISTRASSLGTTYYFGGIYWTLIEFN